MKKTVIKSLGIIGLCFTVFGLSGCGNKNMWEPHNTFKRAIVKMPDGNVLELEIDKWNDYDGEQLQIFAKDGLVYLVSSYNCVFISK